MNRPLDDANKNLRRIDGVKISGICCAVPENVSEVSDLADQFGEEDIAKIIVNSGVERRHTVTDECTSDLCVSAAEKLMSDMEIDPLSIDTLIFVSQTADYLLPASACVIQERLGLADTVAAFDVGLGCSGYVYGLWLAAALISGGGSKKVLLLVGDTISKIAAKTDRSVAALFGDAGTATLLERDESASTMTFSLGTDGKGAKNLIVPGGGSRDPDGQATKAELLKGRTPFDLYMQGAEIFAFTLTRVPPLVDVLTSEANAKGLEIKKFVFHQANFFMLKHLVKRMKLPMDMCVLALQNTGNTSSASIPLGIVCDGEGLPSRLSGCYLFAGFGVGYSWGGCLVELEDTYVAPLIITSGGK